MGGQTCALPISTTTANGPSRAALLKDPAYRSDFGRQPVLPKNLYHPAPFYVWGLKTNGRWAGKAVADYPTAFDLTKRMLRADAIEDVSISSRVIGFRPPEHLKDEYRYRGYDWCIMCRRPVDRKSVVSGKSSSVRVDHGARRTLNTTIDHHITDNSTPKPNHHH